MVTTGVEVLYHNLPVACSFVVHTIREAELVVLVAAIPEIAGAVVSSIAAVMNEYWLDVAVLPAPSADTTM